MLNGGQASAFTMISTRAVGVTGATTRPDLLRDVSELGPYAAAQQAVGSRAMRTLLRDLRAFCQEHENCGELDGGVEGERVWMTCSCGARIVRWDGARSRLLASAGAFA
jgi:hypothetical protein